jgi:hypothetical protein
MLLTIEGDPALPWQQEITMMTTRIETAVRMTAVLRSAVLKGFRRAAPIVLAGVMLAACSALPDISTPAQEAVAHFHEMMTTGQVEQIYAESDDGFKAAATAEQVKQFMSVIDRKLGAIKGSESIGSMTNYGTAGVSITLKYKTEFERGTGTETFRYRLAGGKVLLAYYHVDSNAFLVN